MVLRQIGILLALRIGERNWRRQRLRSQDQFLPVEVFGAQVACETRVLEEREFASLDFIEVPVLRHEAGEGGDFPQICEQQLSLSLSQIPRHRTWLCLLYTSDA